MGSRNGFPVALLVSALLASTAETRDVAGTADAKPKIAHVFFAQHHVKTPDSPYFKLVGNLEALVKVHVDGRRGSRAPDVSVRLALGSKVLDLPLKGPRQLPGPVTGEPVLVEHKYDDCFTAFIPREWIRTGVKVMVELREHSMSGSSSTKRGALLDRKLFGNLNIGAPTRLILTMFDFHYFGGAKGADYPKGWFEELGSKLPVAELELRRARNIVLDELVMPPQAGHAAVRCSSREDYQEKTGVRFDGEQGIAGRWNGALKAAAGAGWGGVRRLYYSNIYGVHSGGTGGGLSGRGNGRSVGILLHELGHAFGLPHWAGKKQYPYVGTMHGIEEEEGRPHVGPVWAFDPVRRLFLAPTHNGKYKNDPMQGGGRNRSGGPHLMTVFSDYSVSRIQGILERTQVVWDERAGYYMQWKQETGSYSQRARPRGGRNCPVEDGIDVISVLASASLVTPEANIVYPPIGPYKAGRLEVFDAASRAGRSKARGHGYDESNCRVCLRVTRGEKVTTYLVKAGLKPDGDPKDASTFAVFAINLPARDGEVTQVDLLHTPDVLRRGVARDCKVLYSWRATSGAQRTETVTALYPDRPEPVKAAALPDRQSTRKPAKPAARQKAGNIARKTVKPLRAPSTELVARYDAMLMERIVKALAAGSRPAFFVRSMRSRARLLGIENTDVLIVKTLRPPMQFKIEWKRLALDDRRSLALGLLREGTPEDHALVAFYSLAVGDRRMAEKHLAEAGRAADAVRAAFE